MAKAKARIGTIINTKTGEKLGIEVQKIYVEELLLLIKVLKGLPINLLSTEFERFW